MQNYSGFLKNHRTSLAFPDSRKPAWGKGGREIKGRILLRHSTVTQGTVAFEEQSESFEPG